MKRGRPRKDGFDALLPGPKFVREFIRALKVKRSGPGRPKEGPEITPRDQAFIERYRAGETLDEIGKSFGITRERVRQRLCRHGITSSNGGAYLRAFANSSGRMATRNAAQAAIEQKYFDKYGMTRTELRALFPAGLSDDHHPVCLYRAQRCSARRRHVPWQITFREWWEAWQESGHWNERGRGKGYCMARWGDDGPYSIDNIYICTVGQNFSDSYITKPAAMRAEKARVTRAAKSNFLAARAA